MRSNWLGMALLGAALLAGCGTTGTGSAPPLASTPTVDDVTDPTQGATMIAIATGTAAAQPSTPTVPATTPTADAATDPTQGATPATAGANGAPVVSVHKTGGVAGVDEFFAVYPNGNAESRGRDGATVQAQVPASSVQALQTLLASPEMAQASGRYGDAAADAFVYELQFAGEGGKTKTVVFTDSAAHPAVLDQLVGTLEALRTSAQ